MSRDSPIDSPPNNGGFLRFSRSPHLGGESGGESIADSAPLPLHRRFKAGALAVQGPLHSRAGVGPDGRRGEADTPLWQPARQAKALR